MTAYDYSKPEATAQRLIARFGRAGAIRRTADSGDAWNPTQSATDYDCTLVVTDYSLYERASGLIGATDRKVLVSTDGVSISPTSADKLVIGSNVYEIKRVDPLEPGDTVVLWTMQVTF